MTYDRAEAIEYASKYWDRPCDDGVFWISTGEVSIHQKRKELRAPEAEGWEPRFVPDGKNAEHAVFTRLGAGGRPEESGTMYCQFGADGNVHVSQNPTTPGQAFNPAGAEAHWFETPHGVTVIRGQPISVQVWAAQTGATQQKLTIDGVPAAATRVS